MNSTDSLLTSWALDADCDETSLVIPDGCRDLIYKSSPGKRPIWFVSDLEESSYQVSIAKGDVFRGYRLKPGTRVLDDPLLLSLNGQGRKGFYLSQDDIAARLESFTTLSRELDQALACLASDISSVAQAARRLGVSGRTLQRFVVQGTGKSPVFWLRLARVRKAGQAITVTKSLAETAYEYGFSDQAHMSREFRRWLSLSPSDLRRGGAQKAQLLEPGYTSIF